MAHLKSFRSLGVILIGATMVSCNLGSRVESTPTLSSEDVLATAQAIAEQTLQAATETPSPTPPTPSPTTPLETTTPEPTSTPSIPLLTADYNANVRFGPGEEYDIIDVILAAQAAEVVGRYDDTPIGTWWFIRRIEGGIDGWVWSGAVTVSGNAAGVPVLEPPPTPTAKPKPTDTPEPTATPTEE